MLFCSNFILFTDDNILPSFQAAFAESVLPYLIHDILLSGDDARSAVLSSQIGGLLSRVCDTSETKTGRAQSPLLRKGGTL